MNTTFWRFMSGVSAFSLLVCLLIFVPVLIDGGSDTTRTGKAWISILFSGLLTAFFARQYRRARAAESTQP